jgi:hypothetical protein
MPAIASRSPRRNRTRAIRYYSPVPQANTRSSRTTKKRAAKADALAADKLVVIEQKLESLGLQNGMKFPSSFAELLSLNQSKLSTPGDDFDSFGDDGLGGFGDFGDGGEMDYHHGSGWEDEPEDEPEDDEGSEHLWKPHSTKLSDYALKRKNEIDNWGRLIAIVSERIATPKSSPSCSCTKSTRKLRTLSFAGISQYTMPLTLIGYVEMEFKICDNDCPLRNGMLDFMSKGYYPSSPVRPSFAFHKDILQLFHEMYMRGSSSKQVYVAAIRALIQSKSSVVLVCPLLLGSC